MPDKSDNQFKFWEELKRRKVVRVITVYAAAAFVIIELTNNITEPLSLPEWVPTLVIVLLAIGFLIAIAISWIFDITPDGIQKTKPSKKDQKLGKTATSNGWKAATYLSMVIIIGLLIINLSGLRNNPGVDTKLEKSIAVLPFKNFSTDSDQEYMCDGLTDEIINHLYKIKSFEKVVSLNSILTYKETTKRIPEIANELGVNFILEGTYKKIGDQIRVTAQLIEAINDKHIWQDDYDQPFEEIITIQTDIAIQIANELKTILSPEELNQIEKRPTENLEAYNYYLRANDNKMRSYDERDKIFAIDLYQKAIELDSNFALAYTKLADCHLFLYWFHLNRSVDRVIESKKAIDAAFSIDPDLPEAHIALGTYYYRGFMDYPKALKQYEIALGYMPNYADCFFYSGAVYRRMGNWQKAVDGFAKAYTLDPKALTRAFNLGETYYLLGEYSKSLDYLNKEIAINPDFLSSYKLKVDLFLKWEGSTSNARKSLEEASLIINPSLDPNLIETAILLDIFEEKYQDALDLIITSNFEANQSQFYYYPNSLLRAMILDLMSDTKNAALYYNLSQLILEARVLDYPDDPRLYSSLGITYAGLGQKEKAINFGRKAVELLPLSKEAYRGVYRLGELARIYVMVDEYELALEQIDYLLSIPGYLSANLLQLDPIWKPLWDLPEFKKLIEKYSDN